ncbi:sensor histidine kinase [Nonomuraea glycinis]|uniref:sensor histidine kinase n=1 Tax=Nonomuraea glycinis TaxID=2047744 RepID=UPI0033A7E572
MSGRIWTGVFALIVLWPIPGWLTGEPGLWAIILVALSLVTFVGLYMKVMWTALEWPHENREPVALVLLWLVAAALAPPLGPFWLFASMFLVITALVASLSTRGVLPWVSVTVVGIVVAIVSQDLPLSEYWWIPALALLFALAMHNHLQLRRANQILARARARAERLAIDNERLRFARDLHDILGHSLSVMTLKSQLAGRFVDADPDRARAEMVDVEDMSRKALSEVRLAVSEYRGLCLSEEVDNARRALHAAGMRFDVNGRAVPREAASVFAWVVREGATNIVRHSQATRCSLRYGIDREEAYLEMADDGRGPGESSEGRGLRGLTERLQTAGGTLHRRPAPDGGFVLRAVLPWEGSA